MTPTRTMTSTPATAAGKARDDDVEHGDDGGDDGLKDGADAIHNCHEASPDGLKHGFNLRRGESG